MGLRSVGIAWLLAVAPLQDPGDRFATLVRNLDHDDIAVRSAASEDLIRLRQDALAPLKRFLQDPPSVESKARAEQIVDRIERRIRWETIKGGDTVGSLKSFLKCDGTEVAVDGAVKLDVEIGNVGDASVDLIPVRIAGTDTPGHSITANSDTGCINVTQLSGQATDRGHHSTG